MSKKRKITKSTMGNLESLVVLAVGGLALLIVGIFALWRFFCVFVSPDWTRAIALLAMALIPVTGRAFYLLGLTESRGKLRGIDAGINRVTKAAATAIDLRATSARAMRQAVRPDPPVVMLPQVQTIIRAKPQLNSGEVVEL